jgi:hypothetical protein
MEEIALEMPISDWDHTLMRHHDAPNLRPFRTLNLDYSRKKRQKKG